MNNKTATAAATICVKIGRRSQSQFNSVDYSYWIAHAHCSYSLIHTPRQSTRFSLVKSNAIVAVTNYLSFCVSLSLNLLLKTCKFPIKCHHLNARLLLFACGIKEIEWERALNRTISLPMQNPPIFIYILPIKKKEREHHQPRPFYFENLRKKKSKIAYVCTTHIYDRSILKIATAHKF